VLLLDEQDLDEFKL
jgi:hypothetical protein